MSHTLRLGIGLALGTAVISGVSNYVAKISVTIVKNPVVFTTLKNMLVAVLLLGLFLAAAKARDLRGRSWKDWLRLVLIGVIGGSVPFVLFFTGLSKTSAVTGSLIHKTLFLWVALLAVPILKERIGRVQCIAFLLLLGGVFALGGLRGMHLGTGELMIFGATILWAVENIIAKVALRTFSSITVASARMSIGSVILIAYVGMTGGISAATHLDAEQWKWTLLASGLLMGYVITWYTALKHAPATLVSSLLVPASLITSVLTLVFQGSPLASKDLISGGLFIIAITITALVSKVPPRHIDAYERAHLNA
ncbi:MAG: DMT family transporter [Patescibacteria group bacterium]|jgi:drug/metabolite transporter (DMT)-like permease